MVENARTADNGGDPPNPNRRQLTLPFETDADGRAKSRGPMLQLLERIAKGRKVPKGVLEVLRAIDDKARTSASWVGTYHEIAAWAGWKSDRSARRWCAESEVMGVLFFESVGSRWIDDRERREREGRDTETEFQFWIVWTELQDRDQGEALLPAQKRRQADGKSGQIDEENGQADGQSGQLAGQNVRRTSLYALAHDPLKSAKLKTTSSPDPTRKAGAKLAGDGGQSGVYNSGSAGKKLTGIEREDLADLARFVALYQRAVSLGVIGSGDRDRDHFFAAREHALRVGENPPALFAWIVHGPPDGDGPEWETITGDDEDLARETLTRLRPKEQPSTVAQETALELPAIAAAAEADPQAEIAKVLKRFPIAEAPQ